MWKGNDPWKRLIHFIYWFFKTSHHHRHKHHKHDSVHTFDFVVEGEKNVC